MSELPDSTGTEQKPRPAPAPVPAGWLWAVRAVPLLALVSAVAAVIVMHVREDPTAGLFDVMLFFLVLPYLHILIGLRRGANLGTLVFAGIWGFTVTGLTLLIAVPNLLAPSTSTDGWWVVLAPTAALGIPNALLVVGSVVLSLGLPAEPGRFSRIVRGVFLSGVYGFLMIMVISTLPGFIYSQVVANQSSALGSVRQLTLCAVVYQANHPEKGFPVEAALLEPVGEDCIDEDLVDATTDGGAAKSGYRFQYLPGPPDADGVVSAFEILARPVQFRRTGRLSYYTDETSVIRSTDEDRPVTKDDPPLD